MSFRLDITTSAAGLTLKKNMEGEAANIQQAMKTAANMAATMMKTRGDADIRSGGAFGDRWTNGLHVEVQGTEAVNNMRISMYHDIAYAGIFETGGTIYGNPLLWIPLSGTDAVGIQAKDYPGELFSAQSSRGTPLLFAAGTGEPRYFAVPSVVVKKKWHLREIQISVMKEFKTFFAQALQQQK